jgi:hypothetical protein
LTFDETMFLLQFFFLVLGRGMLCCGTIVIIIISKEPLLLRGFVSRKWTETKRDDGNVGIRANVTSLVALALKIALRRFSGPKKIDPKL